MIGRQIIRGAKTSGTKEQKQKPFQHERNCLNNISRSRAAQSLTNQNKKSPLAEASSIFRKAAYSGFVITRKKYCCAVGSGGYELRFHCELRSRNVNVISLFDIANVGKTICC